MKTISILFSWLLPVLLFSACQKREDSQKGYDYVEAYKNSLSVPVELHRGAVWNKSADKDTLVFIDTIKIAPGAVYEKTQFVCTDNCGDRLYNVAKTSVVEIRSLAKIYIGEKQRSDTACNTWRYFHRNDPVPGSCTNNVPNIYNPDRWSATQDAAGNIVRREYVFNEEDLQSAK
ncbi:hypothetical protein A8C56_02415 [Niabella ginsenosidivorans]|uniref:Lipoprotein n=1 Tax=Niabella ginsenosidivorans TaxID=1176587 RepID=A0A1A9HZS7_9BACT|nr:hypothetical protein [Niabella ginsenosidivorans]ANH79980.1 hypothetical protein A8C56_02415 [Niabella ginsenosidivorans]